MNNPFIINITTQSLTYNRIYEGVMLAQDQYYGTQSILSSTFLLRYNIRFIQTIKGKGKIHHHHRKQHLALNIGAIKCEPCTNFHATITTKASYALCFLMDIIFVHYFVPN